MIDLAEQRIERIIDGVLAAEGGTLFRIPRPEVT